MSIKSLILKLKLQSVLKVRSYKTSKYYTDTIAIIRTVIFNFFTFAERNNKFTIFLLFIMPLSYIWLDIVFHKLWHSEDNIYLPLRIGEVAHTKRTSEFEYCEKEKMKLRYAYEITKLY